MQSRRHIYLDHAATTPLDSEVVRHMLPYFGEAFSNPSSMHRSGRRAARALHDARAHIAQIMGASPEEIIFTGSGTESDNLAIIGTARAYASHGNHIIISAIEHKAVLAAAHVLEREGFEVSIAPVDKHGMIDVSTVVSLVRDGTILVSVMLGNNEIGTILPIKELSDALEPHRSKGGFPRIHTDACQAAGHVPLDVKALGVDLMTLNGSKVYGPKGIGVLYKHHATQVAPLIVGGGQEHNIRAGTESVALMSGMAHALLKAERIRLDETRRLTDLRTYFINGLQSRIPDVLINGHPTHVLSHIVHLTVPGIEGESMVLLLDAEGVEAATGSACSANDLRPSHVLIAIGQRDDLIHGSIRFSLGRGTTREALDYVLDVFPPIVKRLQAASALTTTYYANHHATL